MNHFHKALCCGDTLALAGMCKNAGKTTALNYCLDVLNKEDMILGLTSIGRDGESSDLVTGTYKPSIYVYKGTLVATAAGMLKNCDITKEILDNTGISTPVGDVIICRALSDGYLDLAGPSTNQQLMDINERFRTFGAQKILIDGAISRKSLCSPKVAKNTLLCTGASYDKSMEITVRDTAYVEELFLLKTVSEAVLETDKAIEIALGVKVSDVILSKEYADKQYFYIQGALTDVGVQEIFASFAKVQGKTIILSDCSKILLSSANYDKLKKKGLEIRVLQSSQLIGITMNPYSAYGNHYEADRFEEALNARLQHKVIDVRRLG